MGERLGTYELISLMSVGGMAELHLATMAGSLARKAVALKLVLPQARGEADAMARFFDEAKLMVSLAHPNIAQVFELGESEGQLYLAMEFIVGVDLWRLMLGEPWQVPEGFAARIGHDVLLRSRTRTMTSILSAASRAASCIAISRRAT